MGDANDAFMRNQNGNVQARAKAQNRAQVLQLKMIGQSHPTGLTPNLLKLFEPRPPLDFKPPPEKRKCPPLSGIAQFVSHFADPGDPEYAPPIPKCETPAQKRARIHKMRLEKGATKAAEEFEKYDPSKDPNTTGDPYKTLFVARLNHETSEHRLKREFETYGPIKKVSLLVYSPSRAPVVELGLGKVRIVTDKEKKKPRGYAFIEYLHTRDMKNAYKQGDGRKVDGKRVLVDVERGRTVANWRPRRLGGGLGSTRVGGEDVNMKHAGREAQQLATGGRPRSEEPRERHSDRRGRNHVTEGGTGSGKDPVSIPTIGHGIETRERKDTSTETVIGTGRGTGKGKGRRVVSVNMVEFVTETAIKIMVATKNVIVIVHVRGIVSQTETMAMVAMIMTAVTLMLRRGNMILSLTMGRNGMASVLIMNVGKTMMAMNTHSIKILSRSLFLVMVGLIEISSNTIMNITIMWDMIIWSQMDTENQYDHVVSETYGGGRAPNMEYGNRQRAERAFSQEYEQ